MARILIGEPSAEVRELLVRILARLGHEPLVPNPDGEQPLPDIFLFEPEADEFLSLAATLRRRRPELPLVICSVCPPSAETRALAPVRHLLKPFVRAELVDALETAAR